MLTSTTKLALTITLFLVAFTLCVSASSGDRAKEFQECIPVCMKHECSEGAKSELSLPFSLYLTGWSCLDSCKYRCMHLITDAAKLLGRPVQQYYGKWPFWRWYGMQEPASVAFSLLNLWAHVRGTRMVRRRVPKGHPMRRLQLLWAGVSVNAWFWSAVFHTRDKPLTEKLDYFAAASSIVFALYYIVIRLFFIFPSHSPSFNPTRTRQWLFTPWTILCALAYLAHITYLSLLPRFDYSYNIIFNLSLGLTHNFLWILYALPSWLTLFRRYPSPSVEPVHRPAFAWKAAAMVLLTTAASALELWDFPPWKRVIDAHALWHAATAPLCVMWYNFLVQDALDEGWRSAKGKERAIEGSQ